MTRGVARSALPGVILGLVALAGPAFGVPLVGLGSLVALLLATPWARRLADRAMLSLIIVAAVSGALSKAVMVPWTMGLLAVLLIALVLVHVWVRVRLRPDLPLLPELPRADALALAGGVGLIILLGLPYLGASADDVLLDLARGFDPVNHVLMTANLITESGPGWITQAFAAGSPAAYGDHPLGIHVLVAGALHLAGVSPSRDIIVPYAWSIVVGLGACGTILGWVGIRVMRGMKRVSTAPAAEFTAVCVLGSLALGGSLVGPFELGHGTFIIGATVGIAASWLALDTRRSPAQLGILLAGGIGLLGAYPPLAVGLAPAGAYVLIRCLPFTPRRSALLVALGFLGGAAVLLWYWRGLVIHVVASTGEKSTPLALALPLVVLTAAGVWLARDHSPSRSPLRAFAAPAGYLAGALIVALGASQVDLAPGDSYYAAKLGEAAWLGALPVLTALVVFLVVRATAALGPAARGGIGVVALSAFVAVVGLLPVGRASQGLVGPATLAQRLLEADRARGEVQITRAARLAGASTGDASAMVEPSGWFHKVSHEDAPAGEWERAAVSASLWLATLRGVRTPDTDYVAHCFRDRGDASAIPCVESWLSEEPERSITIVVGSSASAPAFVTWSEGHRDQVRIIHLDP